MAGVSELVYLLNNAGTAEERRSAALELGEMGREMEDKSEIYSALSASARFAENIIVRRASAYALGVLGSTEAINTLFSLLLEEDEGLRNRAVRSLARIIRDNGIPEAVSGWQIDNVYAPVLMGMLDSENADVRRAAARVLSHAGFRAGLEELAGRAAEGDETCAYMLSFAGKRSMEPLYHMMFDEGGKNSPDAERFAQMASALAGILERRGESIEYGEVAEYADEMYPTKLTNLRNSIYGMLESGDAEKRKDAALLIERMPIIFYGSEMDRALERLNARIEVEEDEGVKAALQSSADRLSERLVGRVARR
ncbi:MAG: HEAT repeat domain-containing protein [Candidatus Micrarchaeota archaeon]